MSQDEEHLRLLSIFHYIVGGLAVLFSFFPLIYAGFGVLMLYASSHPSCTSRASHRLRLSVGSLLLSAFSSSSPVSFCGLHCYRRQATRAANVSGSRLSLRASNASFSLLVLSRSIHDNVVSRSSVKQLLDVEPPPVPTV